MAPLSPKKMIPALLGLIALGLAGNYFGYTIFLDIEFLFGSIFAMLALQLFGYGPGILAAIVISSMTLWRGDHPYAFIAMTLEVIAVGWLHRRRTVGLVLADTLYWFCLGMPFIYFFYRGLMPGDPGNVLIIVRKQAINGIANALIARLLFMAMNIRSRTVFFPVRELMFNLLVLFTLLPATILVTHESREEAAEIDQSLRESVIQVSRFTADNLESWVGQKSGTIIHLAWRVANALPVLQNSLYYMRTLDQDLLGVGTVDRNGISTAFSPEHDEQGKSTIGRNFSDRPYLAGLRRTLKPLLSGVMTSEIGKPEPVVALLAPIVKDGTYQGFAIGILALRRVQQILSLHNSGSGLRCTLLDKHDRVIATNRADLRVMAPFAREPGEIRPLGDGISQWLPALSAQATLSQRWGQSFYLVDQRIGTLAEWRLIVEQPVAPFLQKFYEKYGEHLELIFFFLLITLACAELFSRTVMSSIESLQVISSGLSEKLESIANINWPASMIREVDQLIVNFRVMAGLLAQKFSETKQLTVTLEQRVDERTRALRESEAKYRIIFENKLYAIYIFDLDTLRLLDVNTTFTAMYGYSREEVMAGMTVNALNTWGEDSDLALQEAMHEGSIFIPLRYHRKKDGSIFPVEIAGGPYIWQGRRVMFAIANDITERKRANEALVERTMQLENLTRGLEVKIEDEIGRRRKNEQLLIQQSKLAAMGEMLGAIAHQWRQPLNTLGLCVQNIKDSYYHEELSRDYLDKTVGQSMEQISLMSRTIDDFRNFFRPDKDKAVFDTMLAVGEVLSLFAAQLSANNIVCTLTCRTHGTIFNTVTDIVACPAKLTLGYMNEFEHVIFNLVNNAKDAICERREKEGPAAEKGAIDFEFLNQDHLVVIRVKDNGRGIPDSAIDRVFEPYFTTKDPAKGTGIGLYLCKLIVEDHMQGKLSVENSEHGAAFVISLPAVDDVAS
jgi:PAS domain S-box-containing protein